MFRFDSSVKEKSLKNEIETQTNEKLMIHNLNASTFSREILSNKTWFLWSYTFLSNISNAIYYRK